MDVHDKIGKDLIDAAGMIKNAEHMTNYTFPVIKDAKLLARALESLHKSLVLLISGILKFEYLYKRINLSKDHEVNLKTFYGKCAARYGLNDTDIVLIKEVFFLGKKHKDSGFEFSKFGKVIILDDEYGVFELDSRKMNEMVKMAKKLLNGANIALMAK